MDSSQNNPALSLGHPFTNVQSAHYWSATTNAEDPTGAWFVYFGNGYVDGYNKTGSLQVWCVRGGMHAEAY